MPNPAPDAFGSESNSAADAHHQHTFPDWTSQQVSESDPLQDLVDDPTFDEVASSLVTSLRSSVMNYPFEYGRRYHAYRPGTYPLPNDEQELERLDLTHHLMVCGTGDKLFLAPVSAERTHRILDIGTGTGAWAMEMGYLFPAAEIRGTDLSPVQPTWVAPNVKFEVADVESPWTYKMQFDFIFCRCMVSCIADWPGLIDNIFRHLSPQGWVEFQDFDMRYHSADGSLTPAHKTSRWIDALLDAAAKTGREPLVGPKLLAWVRDAGFKSVTEQIFTFPIGGWPKESRLRNVGVLNLVSILNGLEAFSMRLLCDVAGWDKSDVHALLADVHDELLSGVFHAQIKFHVVCGQKP